MKFTPQQKLIVDYLQEGTWKCMASAQFYMKDDRKRISELNAKGYEIEGVPCDKRCGINHSSKVFMRRIAKRPPVTKYREITHSDGTRSMQPYLLA